MPKGHSVTSTSAIRDHYDRLSAFYRLWWGEHIHHGYWVAGESPAQAQAQLTQRLAAEAGVPRGASVLDVGCGFGASARWLAARLDCRVLGITLSRVQARRAAEAAQREGLDGRLRFAVHDAGDLDTVGGGPFDVVWIIECSEHLPDRARFFASCGRLLRPGGTLALCAWLRGPATEDRPPAALERLCRGMLCPMLSSPAEIRRCIEDAGLTVETFADITARVRPTWTHVQRLIRRPLVRWLVRHADEATRAFVDACQAMGPAYDEGIMAYGMITAHRPPRHD